MDSAPTNVQIIANLVNIVRYLIIRDLAMFVYH